MVKRPIHRFHGDKVVAEFDELAEESIITIFNENEIIVRLLATPRDLEDLAVGHIICEGRGEVLNISVDGRDIYIEGSITSRPTEDLLTAACGACTTGDIAAPTKIVARTQFLDSSINDIISKMNSNQPLFKSTGGVHAASIFTQAGEHLVTREDIGRHNAFDKAIGAAIRLEIVPKIISLSGRVGWELVAKAIRADIEIIIAVGAISSAAEALARNSGITMVGFASRKNPAIIGPLSRIIDKQNIGGVK